MKQERTKELLNELIERDFTIDEICDLFDNIGNYLFAKKESEREEENEDYKKFHAVAVPKFRKWLQETLEKYSLDYTIEEIEL